MEPPSPARLYATLVGAVLFAAGIVGFFHDLSWLNYLYLASGAVGLFVAGIAPRPYALGAGLVYTGLAIADFSSRGWPHLAVGLLGLAAFAASAGQLRGSKSTKAAGNEPRKGSNQFRGSKSTNRVGKEPRKGSTGLETGTQAAAEGS